ncbi:DNA-directed RNA polymerase subunit beta [Paenibacillus sp. FSL K6-1230]|nr:DNA-directed RNA polymerase subunit beta [Paenibacillus massiliensis]
MTEEVKQPAPVKASGWRFLRLLIIPLLLVIALAGGMVTGYVVLGKQELAEVLDLNTWKHVFDLVFAP